MQASEVVDKCRLVLIFAIIFNVHCPDANSPSSSLLEAFVHTWKITLSYRRPLTALILSS